MSFDLALGPSGDLVFAANRDLLGVSGFALYEQRIRTRLKIERGSWVFDVNGTLGSRISGLLRRGSSQAMTEITAYVHEALDSMDDITVSNISIEPDPNNSRGDTLLLVVGYTPNIQIDEAPFNPPDESIQQAVITFQL
jgi:hypothetical protein